MARPAVARSGFTRSFGHHGPGGGGGGGGTNCPVPVSGISSVSGWSMPAWQCCPTTPVSGISSVTGVAGGVAAHGGCTTPPSGPPVAGVVSIILPVLSGSVVNVGSMPNQFVIQDNQGFWRTVNVTTSTTYSSGGTSVNSNAVVLGAQVVAFGTVDSDHTSLDAISVFVLGPVETGTVTRVHGQRIELRTSAGKSVTVVVGHHTTVRLQGKRASISKLHRGSVVTVLGHSVHGGFAATEIRS